MLIDFDRIPETLLPHFYGGEGTARAKMHADGLNRITVGTLVPGASIGLHTHETNSEIVYILRGTGTA